MYLKLWILYFKLQLKSILTYRIDYILGSISLLFLDIPSLAIIWIIFKNIPEINGWSYYEVLFLFGYVTSIFAVADFFAGHVRRIGSMMVSGELDNFLMRPVNPLFMIAFTKIQPDAIVYLIFGSSILFYSAVHIPTTLSTAMIIYISFSILLGSAIFSSLIFILSCIPFWIKGNTGLWWIVNYIAEYIRYPFSIFPPIIRFLLTWLFPVGFTGPVTVHVLLKKESNSIFQLLVMESVVCTLWIIGVLLIWKLGIKKYKSTGS